MSGGAIDLHIERLIVDGMPLSPRHRAVLQASIETELTRLLSDTGLASALTLRVALPSVRGGSIEVAGDSGPSVLGARIARAMYQGIGPAKGDAPR